VQNLPRAPTSKKESTIILSTQKLERQKEGNSKKKWISGGEIRRTRLKTNMSFSKKRKIRGAKDGKIGARKRWDYERGREREKKEREGGKIGRAGEMMGYGDVR